MVVRLLIDECAQAKLLVGKLIAIGHDVQTAIQANVVGVRDDVVFQTAIANNRIILTSNCADFIAISDALNKKGMQHPGVFLVFLQNNPSRDMSYDEIVKAIGNLEATQLPLANTYHSLNSYNY